MLGRHRGHHRFTVGQRKGLGVAAGEPLYVVSKDARTNRVVVGPRARLATRTVPLTGAVLHRDGTRVDRVKLRYRSEPVPCRVVAASGGSPTEILLDEPAAGVARARPPASWTATASSATAPSPLRAFTGS